MPSLEAPALRSAALAACLALAACSGTAEQASPPVDPAEHAQGSPRAHGLVDSDGRSLRPILPVLEALDQALLMHLDPDLAFDMELAFEAARDAIDGASGEAALPEACAAAQVTLGTLVVWHSVTSGTASVDATGRAALEQALLSSLDAVGGNIPQTAMMSATILVDSRRPDEAAEVLAELFAVPGPVGAAYEPAHALVRMGRDDFADPLALAAPLLGAAEAAADHAADAGDPAPATVGLLHLAAGLRAAAEGDRERAVTLYETGARHLAAARGRDPIDSEWELVGRRADCLVNAGWLQYAEAQRLLAEAGLDAARPFLLAAEARFSEAYEAMPDDAEARRGLSLTGDLYYQAEDLDGIREHFGRAARRFDDAEWWNNHAFFCRETGLYEEAYAAYSRCIELAPENARWVNDTGLILLYHLHRDLDHAEALFRRSWELGRAVTRNSFASEEAVEENFLAYTDAMLNLGRLWFEQGKLDEAASVVGELLALAPERPDARMLAAAIERARGPDASDAAPEDVQDRDPEG